MGKGNRKGRGGTVWYSNLCAFLIVLLWRDKIHGKGFKLGRNVVALSGTSIFLFHLNPHSLVLLAFPKPMFVCLSGLRLERLENHHLFWKNEWKKAGKQPPKLMVFGWIFCHWPVATLWNEDFLDLLFYFAYYGTCIRKNMYMKKNE